jgi:hypothetical protein
MMNQQEMYGLISKILGKKISLAWFSDYSAMYLEIGDLHPGKILLNGKTGKPRGEYTIYVGYDWRIERLKTIVGGLNFSKKRHEKLAQILVGKEIIAINCFGRIPEISIEIARNIWISTFGIDGHQPEWSIRIEANPFSCLCVENGEITIDSRN